MKTKTPLSFVIALSAVAVSAQEPAATPAMQPAVPAAQNVMGMPMPRVNPAVLMRMRDQMTFELQQTQRQLNFIDPNDTQLRDSFTERQNELVKQIKDISDQLKTAGGLPEDINNPAAVNPAVNPAMNPAANPALEALNRNLPPTFPNNNLPTNLPRQFDPAMFPGGNPSLPAAAPPVQPQLPTGFDQEQAFANSPWVPQPSKELTELKTSVEALRKETEELKATIKALESQIQLLNRNILLSQPAIIKN